MPYRIVNACCDCATENYPCRGSSCPNRNYKEYYCEECGEEAELYEFEGKELCEVCVLKKIPKVEGSY